MGNIMMYFGKLKVWQQRLATYVSMMNFVMIFYLYIIESPLGLSWFHWLLIILVGVIVLVFFDTCFVMPHALGYTFLKNPEFIQLKGDVKYIKKEIDELKLLLKKMEKNGDFKKHEYCSR